MKRLTAVTGIMVLALAISVTAAEKKNHFYLGAGVGIPTGDAGDGWKMGFHGQGGLGFQASPTVEVIPVVAYHTFGLDDQGSGATGGTLNILMFGGDVKLGFGKEGSKTSPFVFGGAGMGNAKITDVTIPGFGTIKGDSETKVYFNFGGGLDIVSSDAMSFFVKASFVSVATSGSAVTYIPFTAGVRF